MRQICAKFWVRRDLDSCTWKLCLFLPLGAVKSASKNPETSQFFGVS
ncbi:hypothetical protein [Polaromonas sp. CG9_12]|nr:hypothetical protein [Polaromonas sp. CG9_12]